MTPNHLSPDALSNKSATKFIYFSNSTIHPPAFFEFSVIMSWVIDVLECFAGWTCPPFLKSELGNAFSSWSIMKFFRSDRRHHGCDLEHILQSCNPTMNTAQRNSWTKSSRCPQVIYRKKNWEQPILKGVGLYAFQFFIAHGVEWI